MAKEIDAELTSVRGLFTRENFIIPNYQRGYSWKTNVQCDKLWEDIVAFVENAPSSNYFLGSVILNNVTGENGQKEEKLFVVDGQQRITTLMLLMKALSLKINQISAALQTEHDQWEADQNLPDQTEDGKKECALKRRKIMNDMGTFDGFQKEIVSSLFRVVLTEEDTSIESALGKIAIGETPLSQLTCKYVNESMNEDYPKDMEIILKGNNIEEIQTSLQPVGTKNRGKTPQYSIYFENLLFFYDKIKDKSAPSVDRFCSKLLNYCQVITVTSHNTEEAIDIFNSLNSTGMPLGTADLLSAKLSSLCIDESERVAFIQSWKELRSNIIPLEQHKIVDIDEILNEYMYVLRGKDGIADNFLPGVRKYFMEATKQQSSQPDNYMNCMKDPADFVAQLENIAKIWLALVPENQSGVNEEFVTLSQLLLRMNNNFKYFYVTYLYCNPTETIENKNKFLKALLKLFTVLLVKNYPFSAAEFKRFLINLNTAVGKEKASTKVLVEKIETHLKDTFKPDDLKTTMMDHFAKNGLVYLHEYLYAVEIGKKIDLTLNDIEIEHIMPQSTSFSTLAGLNKQEDYKVLVNMLGNKALLEKKLNIKASNDWFEKKQSTYAKSVFPVVNTLGGTVNQAWNKGVIQDKTEENAERIKNFIFSQEDFS